MASVSGKYTSSTSYEVTISGMTVGQKYHLFVADLDSSGNTTGYYCRYSQTATSTSYTYNGTCGSAYSAFNRTLRLFCTGTTSTSHSVGTKYQTSDFPSSYTENKTSYMTAWSGGTYKIRIKLGSGIKSVGIGVDSTTASITATVDTELEVKGSNGWLYLTGITYESGYTYPVYATDQTTTPYSSWTVIGESGSYSDHYVSAPSSAGTRIVNLSATLTPTTCYYQIKAHGVGGTFPDGSTYWSSAVLPTTGNGGYVSYAASNIPTPTRSGYVLRGWAVSESSETVVSTIEFTASSTNSSSPTPKEVWAVWQLSVVTITLDGNGGMWGAAVTKIATKDVGDTLLFTDYSAGLTRSGYTLLGWSANKAATTATYGTDGYVTVGATNATYYAVWKKGIDLFYWDSEGTDAALIAKDQPVSNLTAVRWNKLLAKIKEVADAQGVSFSYTEVGSGGTFYASAFNDARSGILALPGRGTLPAAQEKDNDVLASLFEGSGSLKTALNAAITNFNNS